MVGKRVVSDEQQDIFIQYYNANPSCLDSKSCKEKRNQQWTELSTLLNSVKGCRKTVKQWRHYWGSFKYYICHKAKQMAEPQGKDGKRVSWTEGERKILAGIPLEYLIRSSEESNIDKSPDPSKLSSTPPHITSSTPSTSSILPPEHLNKVPELPEISLSPPPNKCSRILISEKLLPAAKPNQTKPAKKTLPPEMYLEITQPDLPRKRKTLPPEKDTSNPVKNIVPREVAIVRLGMSRLCYEEIEFIQNMLYEKIWNFMAIPTTDCLPIFESCSILEPFGLIFKYCNEDALEWLTTTIERSPFVERNLILSDTSAKLPTTVDMCVELPSDFELDRETSSIFNVLVQTNKSWLDTGRWVLLEDKCVSPTPNLGYPEKLSLVFSVSLTDVPKLREKEFKLHFLLGVVSVHYYKDVKHKWNTYK